ncbi:endo-1,4-beta-xylanase [Flavobacterium sp. RSSA_27]|uniref:endo-1,4-beta-xylanase n=1 Tax=Flavobacterium sp. RSSA_27 TaxID=3447667 RepID=UPI003F40BFE2
MFLRKLTISYVLVLLLSTAIHPLVAKNKLTVLSLQDSSKVYKKLLIGATLSCADLYTSKGKLFLKDFKYVTTANDAKQTIVHPKPGVWKWEQVDEVVAFAKKNNLKVRLHGPISPQASKWIKEDNRTPKELEQNLEEYATAFAQRFNKEPNVKYMDVVNETILADGSWFGPKPGTDSWENPWLAMGLDPKGFPKYIVKAFEIATKYATNIHLVYNQNVGLEEPMWNKVKETVLYLRSKGLRVDGIGWQAHLLLGAKRVDFVDNIDASMVKLANLIDWAHQNKLAFHVTELDYVVKNKKDIPSEREIQKMVYQKLIAVLQEKSKTGTVTLNLWDLDERKNSSGYFQSIYDSKLQPIPAFSVVKAAIEYNK